MKGLLTKDFLTVKKKYGLARLIMDCYFDDYFEGNGFHLY